MSFKLIKALAKRVLPEETGIPFGGHRIPRSDAILHFTILGKTRSGKGLTLKAIIRWALEQGDSALVYDATTDLIPSIAPYATTENPLIVLNPYDSRSWYWAAEDDVRDDADAKAFASILVPDSKFKGSSNDDFFRGHAGGLLGAALTVFARRKDDESGFHWNLRDLLITLQGADALASVLGKYDDTRSALSHLRADKTLMDVLATIQNAVSQIGPIAASWDFVEENHPDRRFSFEKWATTGKGVVVLGMNERSPSPNVATNRVLFERAVGALLSRRDRFNQSPNAPLTWVIVDEAAKFGMDLPRLGECLTRGAQYGVACIVATQSIEDFNVAFGSADASDGILSASHHLAVFHASYRTAEWASREFGEYERTRASASFGQTKFDNDSLTTHTAIERRVHPKDIQDLPLVRPERPLEGYYRAQSYQDGRVFRQRLPWQHLMALQPKPDSGVPPVSPMPPTALRLRKIDELDIARLGLAAAEPEGLVERIQRELAEADEEINLASKSDRRQF